MMFGCCFRLGSFLPLILALMLYSASSFAVEKLETLSDSVSLPSFELENSQGELFGVSQMKGQWSLLTLGFTSCPDICPFVLTNLRAVSKRITAMGAKAPRVVFVGVDPYRDRKLLKDYVKHFGTNVLGVTGSHPELRKLADGIGGNYVIEDAKPGATQDAYDVQHTAFVAMVSPEGKIVARLNPPLPIDETVNFILELVNGTGASN